MDRNEKAHDHNVNLFCCKFTYSKLWNDFYYSNILLLIREFNKSPTAVNGFRKFSSGIGWPAGYIKFLIAVPKVLVAISILASAAGIDFVIFPFRVGIVFFVINLIIEGFVIYACVLLYKYEMNNYMENIKRLEERNE